MNITSTFTLLIVTLIMKVTQCYRARVSEHGCTAISGRIVNSELLLIIDPRQKWQKGEIEAEKGVKSVCYFSSTDSTMHLSIQSTVRLLIFGRVIDSKLPHPVR